jgi:hypothetical protein
MTVLFAKFYNEFLGMLSITWNWVRIQRELAAAGATASFFDPSLHRNAHMNLPGRPQFHACPFSFDSSD